MGIDQMKVVAKLIDEVLKDVESQTNAQSVQEKVHELCSAFPVDF
jgi:glycine/serine hydroxymethyltransferase